MRLYQWWLFDCATPGCRCSHMRRYLAANVPSSTVRIQCLGCGKVTTHVLLQASGRPLELTIGRDGRPKAQL